MNIEILLFEHERFRHEFEGGEVAGGFGFGVGGGFVGEDDGDVDGFHAAAEAEAFDLGREAFYIQCLSRGIREFQHLVAATKEKNIPLLEHSDLSIVPRRRFSPSAGLRMAFFIALPIIASRRRVSRSLFRSSDHDGRRLLGGFDCFSRCGKISNLPSFSRWRGR